MKPNYTYRAVVTKVIDGNTFNAIVDLGFYTTIQQTFRLSGVDITPTLTDVEDPRARSKYATKFVSDLIHGKQITIKSDGIGKYNRWLSIVYIDGEELSLNTMINESGHNK